MNEQQVAQADQGVVDSTPSADEATGRVFVYNGQEYPDPDPALTVDHVRRELARFVPELTNADVRAERRADGATQYVFTRRLGTKGLDASAAGAPPAAPARQPVAGADGETSPAAPNARLIERIGAIRETRLEIFRLAHELVLPNGEFDLDAAAVRGEELERAAAAAHEYARATAGLRDVVLKLATR